MDLNKQFKYGQCIIIFFNAKQEIYFISTINITLLVVFSRLKMHKIQFKTSISQELNFQRTKVNYVNKVINMKKITFFIFLFIYFTFLLENLIHVKHLF